MNTFFRPRERLDQRLLDEIRTQSGQTERDIAETIFGPDGYQQQVNSTCRELLAQGLFERRGEGGLRDPCRYYLRSRSESQS